MVPGLGGWLGAGKLQVGRSCILGGCGQGGLASTSGSAPPVPHVLGSALSKGIISSIRFPKNLTLGPPASPCPWVCVCWAHPPARAGLGPKRLVSKWGKLCMGSEGGAWGSQPPQQHQWCPRFGLVPGHPCTWLPSQPQPSPAHPGLLPDYYPMSHGIFHLTTRLHAPHHKLPDAFYRDPFGHRVPQKPCVTAGSSPQASLPRCWPT